MDATRTITVSLLFLTLTGCTGNLSSRQARQQIAELGPAVLAPEDIQVQRIVTELGERAIAETTVRLAFQFERDADGEWVIIAARLGDRQWIDVADLLEAIEQQNVENTRASLEKLAAGLGEYQSRNGTLPQVVDDTPLGDLLHPRFMTELVRDDAWGRPIHYEADANGYRLRSFGADNLPGSADDIVIEEPER